MLEREVANVSKSKLSFGGSTLQEKRTCSLNSKSVSDLNVFHYIFLSFVYHSS